MTEEYPRIGDLAAIGDGRVVALVDTHGAIVWMCLPQFDSPSVFGALLDPDKGGAFRLAPTVAYQSSRCYEEDTNVLQTTFETDAGRVRVTDALTLDTAQVAPWRELVRRVEALEGEVPMAWEFDPRPDFGRAQPSFSRSGDALVVRYGRLGMALQAVNAGVDSDGRSGRFTASASASGGGDAWLVLTATDDAPLPVPDLERVRRRLERTSTVWRDLVAAQTYDGPWRSAVSRSLLAIRLLTDGRRGAIAAAATTSLPEVIGGKRNYDYRFGWVRDASFALDALLGLGMDEMSQTAVTWLLAASRRTRPRVDPVYALDTTVVRSQHPIDLPGYRGTQPVHLGNQAGSQLQLGGFGDLIETIHGYVRGGHVLSPEAGERLADAADLLCRLWRRPDAGLWELSPSADFGTSKLGCWVALDRVLSLAEDGHVPLRHPERWRREREAIAGLLDGPLFSEEKNSYLQKVGSPALDCGMLLAARRRFGDPAGPRMTGTIDAIRSELSAGGPMFFRYSGMQDQENAFIACSFWMVEALALAGRRDHAAELMDEAVGLVNDVGLLSEEVTPDGRELRGNIPQALSHLSLINAALAIEQGG